MFWDEISNLGPKNKKSSIPHEVILSDGKISSNITEILQKWEADYKRLFEDVNLNNDTSNNFVSNVKATLNRWDEYRGLFTNMNTNSSNESNSINDDLNRDLTKEEIDIALRLAKNGKAVGIDNIPNEVLKCENIADILRVLYNKCFHHGMVPNIWSQTLISPIAKPGKDPRIPTNCRGISLISTVSKIFSTVLNLRLVNYLDKNNVLCEEQNGFRKMRSCTEHIYTLSTIIKMKKKSNKSTFACFIDFSKAFDTVNRDLLWFRLLHYGIDGKFLQILKAMYTNLQICVKLHNHLTNWFGSSIGVRQGDTLSPTLFNLFVNNLATEINELNCGVKIGNKMVSVLLYADDIVLISETEEYLQKMLDTVHLWCQKWQLNINCSKTQIIHFRKMTEPESDFKFKFGEKNIEKVQKYRYLGVELNYCLNYTESVNTLANASSRSLGNLVHKYFKVNGLPSDVYKGIYDTTVCKIMDYGAGVWGGPLYTKCDVIQHRAMRTFLGVGRQTPIPFLYLELGWTPPNIRQKLEMIRLWYHIVNLPSERLPRQIYNLDKTQWKKSIQSMFVNSNMASVFDTDNERKLPFSQIYEKIRSSLLNTFKDSLSRSLENTTRLKQYKEFVSVLDLKEKSYIPCCQCKSYRSIITKLRSSTFIKIRIESGRYRGIPKSQRICQRCNSGSVDDEIHLMLHCQKFSIERINLLSKANEIQENFQSLDDISKLGSTS